ncbi:hypothetical protein [Microbacterium elymi]|uniref:Uncharacterized protein n=1 Tax=Microbacterium elymi TaxID=2909587 RepID=A0ABY5NMG0_9MICO|nr:hypothetical protein [Microbacterium elymi]UUT36360.1 hypothetical protein L2X98_25845 [Microbacterium elymi]
MRASSSSGCRGVGRRTGRATSSQAGGAILTWKGRDIVTNAPRIVAAAEAASLTKPLFRGVVRRMPAAIVLRHGE